jgi:hypothetical protein
METGFLSSEIVQRPFTLTQRIGIVVAACLTLLAAGGVVLLMLAPSVPPELQETATEYSLAACVSQNLTLLKLDTVELPLLGSLNKLCYSQLHGQGLLHDFKIRRLKFYEQNYGDRVLLWMVVIITVSGVAFAGLQILASYRLAIMGKGEFARDGEIAIEQGKLSLKSSITGLFILIVSFAFFFIFVKNVHLMTEFDVERNNSGNQPPTMSSRSLAGGGYAPASTSSVKIPQTGAAPTSAASGR